jgi:hypothetical protein
MVVGAAAVCRASLQRVCVQQVDRHFYPCLQWYGSGVHDCRLQAVTQTRLNMLPLPRDGRLMLGVRCRVTVSRSQIEMSSSIVNAAVILS